MYVVYLDQLVLENLLLNEVTLGIVWLLRGKRRALGRVLFAGVMGTIMGVLNFLLIHSYVAYLLVELVGVIPLMTALSMEEMKLKGSTIKRVLGNTLLCYVIYLMIGGSAQWIHNSIPGKLPMGVILTTSCIITLGSCLWLALRRKKEEQLCEVILKGREGEDILLQGLWDSGNLLIDPYCHRPVSIAGHKVLEMLQIPPEEMRILFVTTVAGDKNMLQAASIGEMILNQEERIAPVTVAFSDEDIFAGQEYQIILPDALRNNHRL